METSNHTIIYSLPDVTIRLQDSAYEVSEGAGFVMVCAELVGQTEREVIAQLNTSSDPG